MCLFIRLVSVSCFLACCLHEAITLSVQPIHNETTQRTNSSLASGDNGQNIVTNKPMLFKHHFRKPISIADTLIVHLINSQPNPSILSQYKSELDSFSLNNSIQSTNSTNNTFSNPALSCSDGNTYWDPIENQCVNCTSSCPSGAYVSRSCNRTHNLECQCHKGSYMSVVDKTCKACKKECPFGWGKQHLFF